MPPLSGPVLRELLQLSFQLDPGPVVRSTSLARAVLGSPVAVGSSFVPAHASGSASFVVPVLAAANREVLVPSFRHEPLVQLAGSHPMLACSMEIHLGCIADPQHQFNSSMILLA